MGAEAKLKELGITLPTPPKPAFVYKSAVQVGNLLYVSGHGPWQGEGQDYIVGKVGQTISQDDARQAARVTGLAILATVRSHLGSLDRVVRTIKTFGMVNAVPDFENHPAVINGFSELLRDVFGDAGVGARSAVGHGSLPGNIPVEIEVIFEVI